MQIIDVLYIFVYEKKVFICSLIVMCYASKYCVSSQFVWVIVTNHLFIIIIGLTYFEARVCFYLKKKFKTHN